MGGLPRHHGHSLYKFDFYPALPYILVMVFIESSAFTKLLPGYLSDDEYRGLQTYLLQKPDAGDIVRGSGGVRKVRWASSGKGKSGSVRVMYYWKNQIMKYGCSQCLVNLSEQRFQDIFLNKLRRLLIMNHRDIGAEILDGINEIKDFKKGRIELRTGELSEPSEPKIIRSKLNLSQSAFAGLLGVSIRTLQDWEQGRRAPQGPAVALLRIAEQHPEVFVELH